jgi:hypothetical protein
MTDNTPVPYAGPMLGPAVTSRPTTSDAWAHAQRRHVPGSKDAARQRGRSERRGGGNASGVGRRPQVGGKNVRRQ